MKVYLCFQMISLGNLIPSFFFAHLFARKIVQKVRVSAFLSDGSHKAESHKTIFVIPVWLLYDMGFIAQPSNFPLASQWTKYELFYEINNIFNEIIRFINRFNVSFQKDKTAGKFITDTINFVTFLTPHSPLSTILFTK